MRRQQWLFVFCVTVSSWIIGCTPYDDRLKGEFNAGSADPFDYAPPYRGTASTFGAGNQITLGNPGVRQLTGGNRIHEVRAFVGGSQTGYYRFPFSPSQITTTFYNPVTTPPAAYATSLDPSLFTSLRVSGAGAVPNANGPPLAYVFDPPAGTGPIPPISNSKQCRAPAGYAFDAFRDDVHYDEQGNIFVAEPNANFPIGSLPTWTYVPVVREVAVASGGEPCQDIKSEKTLLTRPDVTVPTSGATPDGTPIAVPSGRYLAWAMIEPGTAVYRVGENPSNPDLTGVGAQKFGWFQQFLVAYLDGGAIPIVAGANPRMQTQRLFYPRSIGAMSGTACPNNGCLLGGGVTPYQSNDVLEFSRGQAGYSPICQVITYTLPAGPVPRDAATIISTYGSTFLPPPAPPAGSCGANGLPTTANPGCVTPTFVFCLQIS